jgi:hypothetical protein
VGQDIHAASLVSAVAPAFAYVPGSQEIVRDEQVAAPPVENVPAAHAFVHWSVPPVPYLPEAQGEHDV